MVSRREFVQAAVATGVIAGGAGTGSWSALAAKQKLMSESNLLKFKSLGNVTLIHLTDIEQLTNTVVAVQDHERRHGGESDNR